MIRVPTEIVKSRTQTGAYGQGNGSIHSAMSTWRFEGIRGFYRGFGITIGREVYSFRSYGVAILADDLSYHLHRYNSHYTNSSKLNYHVDIWKEGDHHLLKQQYAG